MLQRIGHGFFAGELSEFSFSSKFQRRLLSDDRWRIQCGSEPNQNKINIKLIKIMVQSGVDYMDAYGNQSPSMLKDIAHIEFTSLKELRIGRNEINNFEIIAKFNAPRLTGLLLNENKVVDIRSLRKLCANLENLSLWNNPIKELSKLRQLNSPSLQSVYLQVHSSYCIVDENAMSIATAWESSNFDLKYNLRYWGLKRMHKQNVAWMLKSKMCKKNEDEEEDD